MKTDYAIIPKNWNGIEIQSIQPARAPLPITGTGYRLHFIHRNNVDHMGRSKPMSNHGSPRSRIRSALRLI